MLDLIKQKNKGGISRRLATLCALAMLPGIVLVLFGAVHQYAHERQEALDRLQDQVNALASGYRALFNDNRSFLRTLATLPQVQNFPSDPLACSKLLKAAGDASPQYGFIGVVDLAGRPACGSQALAASISAADRPWFARARDRQDFAIGDYAIGRHAGVPTVHLAFPVTDPAGNVTGVIFVGWRLEWLDAHIKALSLPAKYTLVVTDPSGNAIAGSPSPRELGAPSQWLASLRGKTQGVSELSTGGVTSLVAFTGNGAPEELGFLLAVEASALRADLWRDVAVSAALWLAVLLAGFAVTFSVANRMVAQPLRELRKIARRIADGELDAREGWRSRDSTEIGDLARSLGEMADELKARESRFRHLADHSPVMVWVTEPDGACSYLSESWYRFTGQSPQSGLGFGWLDALHPDDRSAAKQAFLTANANSESYRVEYRVRRKDGEYCWVIDSAAPRFDESGAFIGYLGSSLNVNELKQTEKALSDERELLTSIIDSVPVMIAMYDADHRVLRFNREYERISGWSTSEAPHPSILEEHFPDPSYREQVKDFMARCDGWMDVRMRMRDGRYVETSWANIRLSDGRGVGIGVDITERKDSERRLRDAAAVIERDNADLERLVQERTAQLVQAQKMEAIGQLTGGVAHDFNNVLQGLASCLSVLDQHVPPGKTRTIFGAAKQSIESGARLTKAMLAFARRQTLVPEAIDLHQLLDSLCPLLERTLGGMICVVVDISPDTPAALVDRAQLESAILNLAINARDAMPSGGLLTLRTGAARVGRGDEIGAPPVQPGEYVTVSIADTGTGMDADTLARVFEPFFTTKGVGKGSGLGLSMVHGTVAQSGGGVSITSEPGVGTTVTLYLPCAPSVADAAAQVQAAPKTGDGSTVLLVDDNTMVRTALQIAIEALGYRVVAAASGEAAVALLNDGRHVDALVTDYAMPGMNGAELARRVRSLTPGLPVLMITGYAEQPEDLENISFLLKPFESTQLAASLGALLAPRSSSELTRRATATI